jgi:hypothetical protein
MSNIHTIQPVILALSFSTAGFGYAVFQGINEIVDWQVKKPEPEPSKMFMDQLRELVALFKPTVIVLRSCLDVTQWPCSAMTKQRIRKVTAYARKNGCAVYRYTREEVRKCFAYYGAKTKEEIARAIGKLYVEFERLVPSLRKAWQKQHYRMLYFDAIALGRTYYERELLRRM